MKGGVIQQLGTPDEIYNRPQNKYVADFIGSPSMTFIEGTLKGNAVQVEGHAIPTTGYPFVAPPTEGQSVWIGVRPEHVSSGDAAEASEFSTDATVEIVEPMGSDTLVWTTFAGKPFRFRMDGQARVQTGDQLRIGFDPKMASIFDQSSELRL